MPTLNDYDQFQGLHWETGSLRNYLDYKGILAPHSNQPYSEAMLLGVSGGIVMGYYTFDYQGYDPMVRILTRNTFDPLETIYERLDIETTVRQTASEGKGVQNLVAELDSGSPAIVFADMFSLPYNVLDYDEGMWAMLPILVYGYNQQDNLVSIADRSTKPLSITTGDLAQARGRTKKNKYRLLVHGPPNPDKLKEAVWDGLRDCVNNFTQPPSKGSKNKFGFLAYQKWIDLLQKPNQRGSWQKEFAPGSRMYAGLKSAFEDICIFGTDGGADRKLYTQFLEEASILLSKPELKGIANQFSRSAEAWNDLAESLLPGEVPLFYETRTLMLEKHRLFLNQGTSAVEEMENINDRLSELRTMVGEDFPLEQSQVEDMRNEIASKVKNVWDIESEGIESLARVLGI
jgi:hypothetical protein